MRFGVTVKGLIEEDGKVVGVETDQGSFRAPVTIDGSGRNSVAIKQLGWRRSDDVLKKIAMWTYFKGAKRDEGIDEGATTVAYVDGKNWFWYIPMRYDLISVGLVGSKEWMYKDGGKPQEIFDAAIKGNPWIADHLAGAEQVKKVDVTSDFSYRSEFCAKDGLVLTPARLRVLQRRLQLWSGSAAEKISRSTNGSDRLPDRQHRERLRPAVQRGARVRGFARADRLRWAAWEIVDSE